MKPIKQQAAIFVLFFLALSSIVAPTFADGGSARYERDDHSRRMDGKHMKHLVKALDLTEAQITLFKKVREPVAENNTELKRLHEELRDLTHSSSYTEREATKIAAQISELTQSKIVSRSNAQNEFYSSLSDDQKTTLTAMRDKRGEKRGSK